MSNEQEEKLIFVTKRHWINYAFIFLVVLNYALGIAYDLLEYGNFNLIYTFPILIALCIFKDRRAFKYRITTDRIMSPEAARHGRRDCFGVQNFIEEIVKVELIQSSVDKLVNTGTINVFDERGYHFSLTEIQSPLRCKQLIDELLEQKASQNNNNKE